MISAGSAPLIGSRLASRYEVLRLIARGGMGDVYEARDEVLQRSVAVKMFRGTAPTDRSRFDAEIKALATLNHPNLVHVFDAGEHDGDGFIVLELIDGPTLGAVLEARGLLPAAEVADLGAALAGALAAAHAQSVVHRDVTPANVLCGSDGRARLADFGIARLLDTTRVTAAATTIGTAAYMAPEQLVGDEVTPATDIYALGLVLLEALTGRAAFPGVGHEAAAARLVQAPDVESGVPDGWSPLLEDMTTRDPADRPPASTVVERLRALGAAGVGTPVVVAGVSATGDDPEVDGHAVTTVVPTATPPSGAAVSGGTAVMPALPRPSAGPGVGDGADGQRPTPFGPFASRRALWLAVAGAVLLVGLLVSQSGGGIEVPPTTTAPVAVTAPATTTPTTVATTTPPPPPEPAGKGKGSGKGKDDD